MAYAYPDSYLPLVARLLMRIKPVNTADETGDGTGVKRLNTMGCGTQSTETDRVYDMPGTAEVEFVNPVQPRERKAGALTESIKGELVGAVVQADFILGATAARTTPEARSATAQQLLADVVFGDIEDDDL